MGELARPPDAPYFPDSPLELLSTKEDDRSWFKRNYLPLATGFTGVISYFMYNAAIRRPFYAGIQNYFLLGSLCTWLGYKVRDIKSEAKAERNAIYRHYITLHPEDFPVPSEKKRIKDEFAPWYPAR